MTEELEANIMSDDKAIGGTHDGAERGEGGADHHAPIPGDVNGDGVVDIDDRRLPLVARIYGVLLLIEGVVSIPLIVLVALYMVQELLAGRTEIPAPSLTFVLSSLSTVTATVSTILLMVFGVLLVRNRRKYAARWTDTLIALTMAEGVLTIALKGFGPNLIEPGVQLAILVALSIALDPSLREERRLQRHLGRMDSRSEYEEARDLGMLGRDLSGKGYISLDFFNMFWLFVIGCVFGLVIETIYHFAIYGEYQDRAGLLWGPFSPIYGCGAVILTAFLNRLWKQNWLLIFCSSAVIGGAFEYLTSWFMEVAFGITAWDYTGQWLSIDGRTSGKYMFFWGVLGLAWIKLILPYLLALIQAIPWRVRYTLTMVCFVFMVVDAVMTLMAVDAWYSRVAGLTQDSAAADFFARHFDDAFMQHRFQTMHLDPSKAGRM